MIHHIVWFLLLPATLLGQESWRGRYRVETTVSGRAEKVEEVRTVWYAVLDSSSARLFRIEKQIPYDVALPSVAVFETGNLLLVESLTSSVEVYGRSGEFIAASQLVKGAELDYERIIKFAVYDSAAALLVSDNSLSSPLLVVLTDRGGLLFERHVDGQYATGVALSSDGRTVAVGTYQWVDGQPRYSLSFVAQDGEVRGTVGVGFSRGMFSDDGKRFLAYTNRAASIIELQGLKKSWSYTSPRGRLVLDATWVQHGIALLTASEPRLEKGEWRYSSGQLHRIGRDGRETRIEQLPLKEFRSVRFKRIHAPNGQAGITVELDGKVYQVK